MSNNYNKIILMGRLTRDPETQTVPSGSTITKFGLAVNREWSDNGVKKEEVLFVDVGYWGKRGEVIAQYLKKGDPILVEGRLALSQWTDDAGNKHSKHGVIGESFSFVGGGRRDGDAAF